MNFFCLGRTLFLAVAPPPSSMPVPTAGHAPGQAQPCHGPSLPWPMPCPIGPLPLHPGGAGDVILARPRSINEILIVLGGGGEADMLVTNAPRPLRH
jgi:hypothetical protein